MPPTVNYHLLIAGSLSIEPCRKILDRAKNKDQDSLLIYQHDYLLKDSTRFKNYTFDQIIGDEESQDIHKDTIALITKSISFDNHLYKILSLNRLVRTVKPILLNCFLFNYFITRFEITKISLGVGSGINISIWKTLSKQARIPLKILPITKRTATPKEPPRFHQRNQTPFQEIPDSQKTFTISTGSKRIAKIIISQESRFPTKPCLIDNSIIRTRFRDLIFSARHFPRIYIQFNNNWKHLPNQRRDYSGSMKPIKEVLLAAILKEVPKALKRIKKARKHLKKINPRFLIEDTENGRHNAWAAAAAFERIPTLGYVYDAIPTPEFTRHFSHLITRSISAQHRMIENGHDSNEISLCLSHEKPQTILSPRSGQAIVFLGTWVEGNIFQSFLSDLRLIESAVLVANSLPDKRIVFKFHPPRLASKRGERNSFLGIDQRDFDAKSNFIRSLSPPTNFRVAPFASLFSDDILPDSMIVVAIDSMAAVEAMHSSTPAVFLNSRKALNYWFPWLIEDTEQSSQIYSNEPTGICKIVCDLARNPEKRQRLIDLQLNYIHERYWPKCQSVGDYSVNFGKVCK